MICTYQTVFGQVWSLKSKVSGNLSQSHIAVAYCTWKRVSTFSTAKNTWHSVRCPFVFGEKKLVKHILLCFVQVLREAVADSVVEVEDAGVAEAIVEAEAVGGVDVRDSRFKSDFYSYWFWGQVGVCNRAAGVALAAVDADAAGLVVVVAIPGDAAGLGVVRRLSSSRTSTRGSS